MEPSQIIELHAATTPAGERPAQTARSAPVAVYSGFGIASSTIAFALLLGNLVIVPALQYYKAGPVTSNGVQVAAVMDDPVRALIVTLTFFFALFGVGLSMVGMLQEERRKEFVVVGLALNLILVASTIIPGAGL